MMKTLNLILALVLAFTAPALAQEASDTCPIIGELAEVVMTARQSGVPMSSMMDIAEGHEMSEIMVLEAYQQPLYTTPSIRAQVISEFTNSALMACYSAFR